MVFRLLKRKIKEHLPSILKVAPPSMARLLINRYPHWITLVPPGKVLIRRKYLGRFTVLIDTTYLIEREMLTAVWEPQSVKVIDRFVRPGDVCIDVGANVGALTLALARATGETGRVFAFEPGPPTYRRLTANILLNPSLSGVVHTCQLGVSDKPGILKWVEDPSNRGNGWLLRKDGTDVPVVTLDGFCQKNAVSRVSFIKVDVEGMEYEVFKGAVSTLRGSKPILYFETRQPFVKVRGFDIFGEIERMLTEIGYRLFKVDQNGNIARTTSSDLSEDTLAMVGDFS